MQHLGFDLSQYRHRLPEITEPSFVNHLNSIMFSGNYNPDPFCIDDLEEDFPVCTNIQKLYLEYWVPQMRVSNSSFQAFLLKFPNITHLQLYSINNADVDFNFIKSSFPQLEGLDVGAGLDDDKFK